MALCKDIKECPGCRLWNETRRECDLILVGKELPMMFDLVRKFTKRTERQLRAEENLEDILGKNTALRKSNRSLKDENAALRRKVKE